MSGKILAALFAGILIGYCFVPQEFSAFVGQISMYVLYGLLFLIGIDIGSNRNLFSQIKNIGREVGITTGGTIIGTLTGGLISSLLLGFYFNEGLSVAAGFGWYSLSAVILTPIAGASLSIIAFMANVFREVISFVFIPFIAKRFGRLCAVAAAGATSMDTTLAIIRQSTDEETAVVSFTNGVLLSAAVPVLVPFLYEFFK